MSTAAAAFEGLVEIRLYGVLGKRFGRVHRLAVASVREAVQALGVVLPGFAQHLVQHSAPGYQVFLGKRGQNNLGEQQLEQPVSATQAICLVPVVAGAKRGGLFQTILGVVLIAAGVFFQQPWLVNVGVSMTLGGVVQLFTRQRTAQEAAADNLGSKSLGGPINTTQQGLPVPLRYGRMICGGAIISAGLSTEEIVPASAPGSLPTQSLPPEQPLDPVDGNGVADGGFDGAGNLGGDPDGGDGTGGTGTDGGGSGGGFGGDGVGT